MILKRADEDEISVGTATIVYYSAKFISRRPADPVEAFDQPAPAITPHAMDKTSLMGAPPTRIMPTPKPHAVSDRSPEPKDPADTPKITVVVTLWGRPVDVELEYWQVEKA